MKKFSFLSIMLALTVMMFSFTSCTPEEEEEKAISEAIKDADGTITDHIFTYAITAATSTKKEVCLTGCLENLISEAEIPDKVRIDGVTYKVTAIGEKAFYKMGRLVSISIPTSVMSIGSDAFEGCNSLTSITIPENVTSIGDRAFLDCSSLYSIILPESVTSIEEYAFYGCSSLTSTNIPKGVTSIGNSVFSDCSSLASITIPENVTSIGNNAFSHCSSLASITIPVSVTSIGSDAFVGCSGLVSISVDQDNPTYDSRDNCNAIIVTASNTLIVGCKATTIPVSVTSIGSRAFYYCRSLTSITIPEGVTSIGYNAFSFCSDLDSITIPASVMSIGSDAFEGCSSLTSISVDQDNPEYDSRDNCNGIIETANSTLIAGCKATTIPTSVTRIGNRAFYYCRSLTSILIPESVTSIGNEAFDLCDRLAHVTNLSSTPQPIDYNTFYTYGILHVKQGCGDAYKKALYWNQFLLIVEDAQ